MTQVTDQTIKRIARIAGVVKSIGFNKLRDCQAKPIQTTLQEKDQIVVLPTGGGKSAIYIVPTLCCEFRTLIFSPLVALIKDQLESLQEKGCRAAGLRSTQSAVENSRAMRDWCLGEIDFLLVAPERLGSEEFQRTMRTQPPDMIVVDEIHVASEAGFNFREDYRKIAPFITEMNPRVFLGLTATLPLKVEDDVREIFDLRDAIKSVEYYDRVNLHMESRAWTSEFELADIVNSINGSVIVYFSTVKRLEATFETIKGRISGHACIYHGQMSKGIRESNQNMFMDSSVRVVFATNSFGMGVDKSNIRGVIYADIPGSPEEISQGFGRGGRDDAPCRCVFYWNNATLDTQKFFIEMGHPERSTLANFYHTIHMNKAKDGLCTMNLREVCQQARINPMYSQAIMSILLGEGIVERVKLERPLRVKPLTEPKTKATKNLLEKIVELGVRDEIDGFYEVDREFLGDQLSVQQGAITRNLRTLENQGVIRMHDPGGSKPLRVLKEIHEIDFKKLDNRRRDAIQRLKQAGEFYRTDDDKKHKFMETYFQSENEK